jgi:hypothetical protein
VISQNHGAPYHALGIVEKSLMSKDLKVLRLMVRRSFKILKIKTTIFREIGCVRDTNGKHLMSGILQR